MKFSFATTTSFLLASMASCAHAAKELYSYHTHSAEWKQMAYDAASLSTMVYRVGSDDFDAHTYWPGTPTDYFCKCLRRCLPWCASIPNSSATNLTDFLFLNNSHL